MVIIYTALYRHNRIAIYKKGNGFKNNTTDLTLPETRFETYDTLRFLFLLPVLQTVKIFQSGEVFPIFVKDKVLQL